MFRIGVRTQGDMIGSHSAMQTAASPKRNKMKKNGRHSYGDGLAVTGLSGQVCNNLPAALLELFVPHTASQPVMIFMKTAQPQDCDITQFY